MKGKMKLGEKVKCYGYLKKVPTKYVYANEECFERLFEDREREWYRDNFIIMDECGERQTTREFESKVFEGLFLGFKSVSTANDYLRIEDENGEVIEKHIDEVMVQKERYMDCIHVAYGLNKTRLVPCDMFERLEV